MTPNPWIPIRERRPEFPCIMLRVSDNAYDYTMVKDGNATHVNPDYDYWTHWQPFVPPEALKPEEEVAFEKVFGDYASKVGNRHFASRARYFWLAALEWAKAKK